jgi:L-arabinose isomerase
MAQPVIVDTDILIDFGLDRADAVQTMAKLEENYTITVSVITAMHIFSPRSEIVRGLPKQKRYNKS